MEETESTSYGFGEQVSVLQVEILGEQGVGRRGGGDWAMETRKPMETRKGSHRGRRAGHGQPDEARDFSNTWPCPVYSQKLIR